MELKNIKAGDNVYHIDGSKIITEKVSSVIEDSFFIKIQTNRYQRILKATGKEPGTQHLESKFVTTDKESLKKILRKRN
tara:strand:- start:5 stop:241 length:237 start_codon:yes stop_codon:yes gene_type:complete